MNKKKYLYLLSILVSAGVGFTAANFTVTHEFTPGEILSAAQLNQNFDDIETKINQLDTSVTALGGGGYSVNSLTGDYTVSNTEDMTLFLASGYYKITLPTLTNADAGFNIIIKRTGSDIVWVETDGSDLVDGLYYNIFLNSNLATVNITFDGTDWWMLSSIGTIDAAGALVTCGSDGGSNCYLNTSATNEGYALSDQNGELLKYGSSWHKASNSAHYLVNDQNSFTNYHYSTNSNVASGFYNRGFVNEGGVIHGKASGGMNIGINSPYTTYLPHAGADDEGFWNTQAAGDTNFDTRPCYNEGAQMARRDDFAGYGGTLTVPASGTYWTASVSASGTNDGYRITGGAISSNSLNSYIDVYCVWASDTVFATGLSLF
jgi:hypothetical protein